MRRRYLLAAAALAPAAALLAHRLRAKTELDDLVRQAVMEIWTHAFSPDGTVRYLGPLTRFQSSRFGLAAHVLRGRPLAYRISIENGTLTIRTPHTRVDSCTFIGSPTAMRGGEAFFPPPPRFQEDW